MRKRFFHVHKVLLTQVMVLNVASLHQKDSSYRIAELLIQKMDGGYQTAVSDKKINTANYALKRADCSHTTGLERLRLDSSS